MGVRKFLDRADDAVQTAHMTVTLGVVLGAAALVVAAVALIVAVKR